MYPSVRFRLRSTFMRHQLRGRRMDASIVDYFLVEVFVPFAVSFVSLTGAFTPSV